MAPGNLQQCRLLKATLGPLEPESRGGGGGGGPAIRASAVLGGKAGSILRTLPLLSPSGRKAV